MFAAGVSRCRWCRCRCRCWMAAGWSRWLCR